MLNLNDFPIELLEQILLQSDPSTIVCCRQVSKHLNGIVIRSKRVEYMLQLDMNNLQDGPPGGMNTSERLQCLQRRNAAWDTLHFTSKQLVESTASPMQMDFSKSHLVCLDAEGVKVLRTPSFLRNIAEKSWTIEPARFEFEAPSVVGIKADADQDLLMIAEKRNQTVKLHLHSLTAGEKHPDALQPNLLVEDAHGDGPRSTIETVKDLQIQDDYILINNRCREDDFDCLVTKIYVFNWRTGALMFSVSHPESLIALLLPDDLLLLVYDRLTPNDHLPCTLSLTQLGRPWAEMGHPLPIYAYEYICHLHFPEKGEAIRGFRSEISAMLGGSGSTHGQAPFTSGEERLLVIHAEYDSSDMQVDEISATDNIWFTALIPLSTIMGCRDRAARGHRKHFPWEEWGPGGVHMLPTDNHVGFVYIDGAPVLMHSSTRDRAHLVLEICDFGAPFGQRRRNHLLDGVAERVHTGFIYDIEASLPNSVGRHSFDHARFERELRDDSEELAHVLLGEDAVVLVVLCKHSTRYIVWSI
ncbi:hypothetical protein EIP91_010486 [Steccherinum ochraceum]|uniref:F-box domain-containing protein n=1 Tax=Steccherinum ochraceum TaxID=92696 RepID=A0A4R0RJI3_9APHY|nr:hypothetical protein EIP91_010486 [Steccherinum ochraceum]